MKEFVKENLYWTREPKQYVITDSLITIETEPNTDLWQRTYYGFSNDNAPCPDEDIMPILLIHGKD